jgi:arginine/lysine/ornithine decarboxylase
MCYPPGIPILAPGEKITVEVLEYIKYAKEKGCFLTGTQDSLVNKIQTVKE